MTQNYRIAPPKAAALLGSLRGLGYSAGTALADIIDNSIAAHAANIGISFHWSGKESVITVEDDGSGMSPARLDKAMRLGELSAYDVRDADDLGRFGLGLKTASFSQCRRLTVATRSDNLLSALFWDLDVLQECESGEWRLMEGNPSTVKHLIERMPHGTNGTLVIWEKLDRIITAGFADQDFLDLIDSVERHLAMVFHKYLEGPNPRLSLSINNKKIAGWDPFMTSHPATWRSPVERIQTQSGVVEVQGFVLPHQDRMEGDEHESAAGPEGWTAQQGFYVYRNLRMLVAGSWLGLGPRRSWTKEESHRLARIRLHLPNTADTDWKIDIRKSTASPPLEIRERLGRLAEDTRSRARRVFAHRGQNKTPRGVPVQQAWVADRTSSGLRYRIDENHPAVKMVLEDAGAQLACIKAMLTVIEETVPVQRIWLDTAENRDVPRTSFATSAPEAIAAILNTLYRNLVLRKGMSSKLAREHLLATEPFNLHPDLVAGLPDEPNQETVP